MQKKKWRSALPLWCFLCYGVGVIGALLLLIATISARFADAYNASVGAAVRAVMAHLTSFLPFSLAEILLYTLPILVVFVAVIACRRYTKTWRDVGLFLLRLLAPACLLLALFAFGFGVGYHTHTLDERIDLAPVTVDAESLSDTAAILVEGVNALADEITYDENGASVMPYDLSEMNGELLTAFAPVCERYDFIQPLRSRVKPVLASKAMSYTHITGVYSFYTGEANLNTHFPDYTLPYTAAHELSHQRGVARENEANFVAFLVLMESEDPYLRYCGYLNMLEYVASALYREDAARYREVMGGLDERVKGELRAYAAFFEPYEDSVVSDVSDAVNDTYLKANGNEAGTKSYGLVVELAVAYYHQ